MALQTPVIQVEGLTRRFGANTAVNNLTLTVDRGEVFGLLGHNGAGKTTTVRLLNGVLNPSAGTASVLGLSPVKDGSALRRRTGVLTETPSLYESLSARDNLQIFADLFGIPRPGSTQRVEEMLGRFDLADRANEKTGGYSKGMKQRLALARAFLHQPELLFLDEPTAGLDPVAARQVNDLIVQISRDEGRTVILATHNLHDAQRFCDRVAVMEQGSLVALGTPEELARQYHQNISVEIEVDAAQSEQAASLIQAQANLATVQHKDAVLMLEGVAHTAVPDLLALLVNAGVRVYRVSPGETTLEDVYFALHRQRGAA